MANSSGNPPLEEPESPRHSDSIGIASESSRETEARTKVRRKPRAPKSDSSRMARLALVPMVRPENDPRLCELEHAVVYLLIDLVELLGGQRFVDLYPEPAGGAPGADPEAVTSENLLNPQELSDAELGREMERARATHAFSGSLELEDHEAVSAYFALTPRGEESPCCEWYFRFDNVAPEPESELLVSLASLHRAVREIYDRLRKEMRWRFAGPKERQKFYRYRLDHTPTSSYSALRDYVKARRLSHTADQKLYLYKRATQFDPCFGESYRNVGYLYKEQKKYKKAISFYREASRNLIDREILAQAHAELGLCLANAGCLDEAIREWQTSRRWDPKNTDVYANLAIAYEEKGSVDKAIRHFSLAQNLDPNYYWACRGLGRIFCNQGEWKKAIRQLELQISLAPRDAWGHYALGSCYARENDLAKAREHLRRALELDPDGDAGRRAFQCLMQIEE